MATKLPHVRDPEAPPRRRDRPYFGDMLGHESRNQDRPLTKIGRRWARRLAEVFRRARQSEGAGR